MELQPNTLLSGKYIIKSLVGETDLYYTYLANAPFPLGEMFLIVELFPKADVERDENDYITMSPEKADAFETMLERFTLDCGRLMHMSANRYFGVRDLVNEKGTAYAVVRNIIGESLPKFASANPTAFPLPDNVIDGVYECLKSCAAAGIHPLVKPEHMYLEQNNNCMFAFQYMMNATEADMSRNTAELLHFMITGKPALPGLPGHLLEKNKYGEAITGILKGSESFQTFASIDESVGKFLQNTTDAAFRVYAKSAAFFLFILAAIASVVFFGVQYLARIILG